MLRNLLIAAGLLAYLALVVLFALCRQWCVVVQLLALGGLVESISHEMQAEEPSCSQRS